MCKKRNIPWNKGLTITDPRVRKYSEKCSETKKKTGKSKGENNPMFGIHRIGKESPHYGKKHSAETRKRLSELAKKRFTNKKNHPSYGRQRPDLAMRNKKSKGKNYEEIYGDKAALIKEQIGRAQLREKSHFWRGGLSFEPYSPDFDQMVRRKIRSRDICCQVCGKLGELQVHHIDYDKKNSCSENLISLCPSCHTKTNFGRRYWLDMLNCFMSYKHSMYNERWDFVNKPMRNFNKEVIEYGTEADFQPAAQDKEGVRSDGAGEEAAVDEVDGLPEPEQARAQEQDQRKNKEGRE